MSTNNPIESAESSNVQPLESSAPISKQESAKKSSSSAKSGSPSRSEATDATPKRKKKAHSSDSPDSKSELVDSRDLGKKIKLLLLYDLMRNTDENHMVTITGDIIPYLKRNGVSATKQTIYSDINQLRQFGEMMKAPDEQAAFDIVMKQTGRDAFYYMKKSVGNFEPGELKLLLDAAQCSKFITTAQSRDLVKKIESLASETERKRLHSQITLDERVKTDNEEFFSVVNKLHDAIDRKRQIRFHYYKWTLNKTLELRNGGNWYQLSPLGLIWDAENYYLVAYYVPEDQENADEVIGKRNAKAGIRHYRVDKIKNDIEILGIRTVNNEVTRTFNVAKYSKQVFGMYGSETKTIVLEVENNLAGVFIDRFGKKSMLIPCGDGKHFRIHVQVQYSPQFRAWILSLGSGVKIVHPPEAVDKMREMLQNASSLYVCND